MPDVERIEIAHESRSAESRLWCSALALLVNDARCYWEDRRGCYLADDNYRLEQAFDDVCRAGPMLRHLCDHTGHDAAWISEGFARWCERDGSE